MTDKELIKLLTDYINEKEPEMLKDLSALIEIPSVRGEASPGMPYGEGPYRALMTTKLLLEKYGLKTKEYDNRVISGDMIPDTVMIHQENEANAVNFPENGADAQPLLKGNDVMACSEENASALPPLKGEVPAQPAEGFSVRKLDILAHMDVVAAGDGWTVTEPFKPLIKNGKIYGRGTSDDKGPAIAALYALRAIKELTLPVNAGCRLVLGSDEECGSSDLPAYLESEGEAEMTFTPDSSFPVTNIEKGRFTGKISFGVDYGANVDADRTSLEDFETFLGVTTSEAVSSDDETSCEFADTAPDTSCRSNSAVNAADCMSDNSSILSNNSGTEINEVPPKRLINFTSGDTLNIVPGQAEAILQGFSEDEIRDAAEKFREKIDILFVVEISRETDYAKSCECNLKSGSDKINLARANCGENLNLHNDEANGEPRESINDAGGKPSNNINDTNGNSSDKILKIAITGHGAHASTPEHGINAGVILLNILAELDFDNKEFDSRIKKLAEFFPYGDHNGKALGFNINDEISGRTTLSPDIFKITEDSGKIEFDARTSLAFESRSKVFENIVDPSTTVSQEQPDLHESEILGRKPYAPYMEEIPSIGRMESSLGNVSVIETRADIIASAGFVFTYNFQPAHVVNADSDFVKTLLRSYEDVTGKEGRCMAIGGGTYVHEFKHGVAFGAVGEDTDTHMHGADEFMDIEELKSAAVVFALSIVRLLKN